MIPAEVCLVGEDPGQHGAVFYASAGDGGVDGVIDQALRPVCGLKAAEGQVVVPGQHGEEAVLFIQIIVVDHGTGVAVKIQDEIVGGKIADHAVRVDCLLRVFAVRQLPEGLDQTALVGFGDIRFGIVKEIRIL